MARYGMTVTTFAMSARDRVQKQPTHLPGLSLVARVADARGDATASRNFRRRLLAAEPAEKARNLPEYTDHAAEISRPRAGAKAMMD
jgi:hypothetical protein